MSGLSIQNISMRFDLPNGECVQALKDVTLDLKAGELMSVLGPSGCGKTTLLNITAGFLRPTSGQIILGGNEINGPGVERGMVFQQGALFEWLTVAENVNFGLRMKKEDPVKTAKKVEEWLDIVIKYSIKNDSRPAPKVFMDYDPKWYTPGQTITFENPGNAKDLIVYDRTSEQSEKDGFGNYYIKDYKGDDTFMSIGLNISF